MAEGTTRRLRKDPRRGMLVSIPNAIAENLPGEGEFSWSVNENRELVATLVEISRTAIKVKPAASEE